MQFSDHHQDDSMVVRERFATRPRHDGCVARQRGECAEVAKCAKQGVVRKSREAKAKLVVSRRLLSEFMRDLTLSVAARRLLLTDISSISMTRNSCQARQSSLSTATHQICMAGRLANIALHPTSL
jgi:hypothetical protein